MPYAQVPRVSVFGALVFSPGTGEDRRAVSQFAESDRVGGPVRDVSNFDLRIVPKDSAHGAVIRVIASGAAGSVTGGIVSAGQILHPGSVSKLFFRAWVRGAVHRGEALAANQHASRRVGAVAEPVHDLRSLGDDRLHLLEHRGLFELRQELADPRCANPGIAAPVFAVGIGIDGIDRPRRKRIRSLVVIVQRQPELFELVLAFRTAGRFTGLLHGGKQHRDQNRDDRNHDEQFNESKTATLRCEMKACPFLQRKKKSTEPMRPMSTGESRREAIKPLRIEIGNIREIEVR